MIGGLEEQIRIEIDEKKLAELGSPISEITRTLEQENLNQASGSLYDWTPTTSFASSASSNPSMKSATSSSAIKTATGSFWRCRATCIGARRTAK